MEKGELGLEMYLIIEGEVDVILEAGQPPKFVLSKGVLFGEMALLNPIPSVRTASIRAKTNVSLAVLGLEDFQFIMKQYPKFSEKIHKIAQAKIRKESGLLTSEFSAEFNEDSFEDEGMAPMPEELVN